MSLESKKQYKKSLVKELGTYEGAMIILKTGPYGPYLQHKDKKVNLKYLLQKTKKVVEDLEFEDVIEIIKYPMLIGHAKIQGSKEAIVVQIGPYGKYMKFHGKNYRIPQKDSYTFKECIGYISKG